MKEIKAYIRDSCVDEVVDAIQNIGGVPGVAVLPVRGYGHAYDGDGELELVPMSKLEVDVTDEYVEPVIGCIVRHARTGSGHPGDGKIHVTSLEDAIRIGDGGRGDAVLERAP